jgi:hydroxymethylpyrimidine/phosphomethylpyrimidine kinase
MLQKATWKIIAACVATYVLLKPIRTLNKYFLTISASDNSGGAGIQQDIKTAHDLGYRVLTAVTGITVQNFREVFRIDPVNPDLLEAQIRQNIGSFPVKVIKIGAVFNQENIMVIACCLKKNKIEHGTGCTLSSALACNLGEGYSLTEAYKRSSEYLVNYYNTLGRTE